MTDSISVPILVGDSSVVPQYAYAGDAGIDLRSAVSVTLNPFERQAIPCGISLAIPPGYAGLILPRSGLALKQGLSIVNAPGLIDSNYRGEIQVIAINLDPHIPISIEVNDRIAQLMVIAYPQVNLVRVAALDDTVRNAQGFGSSGMQ